MVVPNNLGIIIAVFPSNTNICISSVGWAQSATLQSGSQVTPELWVLSVELALVYLASTYNLEVALRFLVVNLCTLANSVPRNYKITIVNTLNKRSKHKFFVSDNINQCLCYGIEECFYLLFILLPHAFWLLLLSVGLCRWLAPLCCNLLQHGYK